MWVCPGHYGVLHSMPGPQAINVSSALCPQSQQSQMSPNLPNVSWEMRGGGAERLDLPR